jgi:predicted aspartyl protease
MRRGLVIGGGIAVFAIAIAAFAFRNDQDGQTATAPLTRLANGHYTTPVSINGAGPFAFIVDTGATSPVINPRTSQALGLWGIPGVEVHGAGGSQTSTLSIMRSYKSGVYSRTLDMIVVIPSSKLIPDGVIGMNAFTGKRLAFDFQRSLLTASPSAPTPAGFAPLPIEVRQGSFIIAHVTIDGVAALAMIDTGARRTGANLELEKALGLAPGDKRLQPAAPVQGATSTDVPAVQARVHALTLGGVTFHDPNITFADLPVFRSLELDDGPAVILGIDLLHTLRGMAIDYPRAELQLQP